MEELLVKLAKQLESIDEASLLDLWEKYARIVDNFEPTQRWQEAVLILSFLQAKKWKNQLFNYHWAKRTKLLGKQGLPIPTFSMNLNKKIKEHIKAKEIPFEPCNTEK